MAKTCGGTRCALIGGRGEGTESYLKWFGLIFDPYIDDGLGRYTFLVRLVPNTTTLCNSMSPNW